MSKRKAMSTLPTMDRLEPGKMATLAKGESIEPIEPAAVEIDEAIQVDNVAQREVPDDIIFVTVTIPISRAPRGTPPRTFDLRPKGKDRETLQQIHDGYYGTYQTLSDGTVIRSATKAMLKVLEAVREAMPS